MRARVPVPPWPPGPTDPSRDPAATSGATNQLRIVIHVLQAAFDRTGEAFEMDINWVVVIKTLIESIVYSLIGIVMFALSFVIIKLVTPFSLRKEIEEDQNTALAIMIGSVILGLAIVIAAAIGG